ncbi:MAG: Stp1/IreP family PP2C-type Ser/Thr phosphatase [Gallionellaceae bacterium]|nr:Stp1/IreP family PP2C-type Ser/Thr phosphatase [Gallionellaceae bacterium]
MAKQTPSVEMVALSDTGMVRALNEDSIFTSVETGLAILADGMGGYSAGEVASAMVIDTVSRELLVSLPRLRDRPLDEATPDLHEDIEFTVGRANAAIHQKSHNDPDCEGMGSTLVVAALLDGQITVGHVGDSRLYRFREGTLEQVTRDHSWLDEQLAMGAITVDQAMASRYKNIVTRGMGIEEDVDVEIHDYPLQDGDIYLLCSDGLSDMIEDAGIEKILLESGSDLDLTARRLIDEANENGGRDNVSVILIRSNAPAKGWLNKIGGILGRK